MLMNIAKTNPCAWACWEPATGAGCISKPTGAIPTPNWSPSAGSPTGSASERMAAQYGATGYLDFGEMMAKEKLDLVSVITPDDKHYQPYKQALQARVNCFFEKPLTMDVEEARELVALGAAAGRLLRHQLQPSLRHAVPTGRSSTSTRAKSGGTLFLHWRFTGGHYPERQTLPLAHLLYMQSHGFNMLQTFGGEIVSIAGHAFDPARNAAVHDRDLQPAIRQWRGRHVCRRRGRRLQRPRHLRL